MTLVRMLSWALVASLLAVVADAQEKVQFDPTIHLPGFEETMRCNSVSVGETPTPITPEQQKECAHLGHAENAGRQDEPKQ